MLGDLTYYKIEDYPVMKGAMSTPDARRAIEVLFNRAAKAGLLPAGISIDWAP